MVVFPLIIVWTFFDVKQISSPFLAIRRSDFMKKDRNELQEAEEGVRFLIAHYFW